MIELYKHKQTAYLHVGIADRTDVVVNS